MGDERFEEELELEQFGMRGTRVHVTIDAHGMGMNGKRVFVHDHLVGGSFEPSQYDETCRVLLVGRWNSHWRFVVGSRATARRLLRATGCDSNQTRLRVPFMLQGTNVARAILGAAIVPVGALLLLALTHFQALLPTLVVIAIFSLLVGSAILGERVDVIVGTDGVLKRERIGFSRFVSYSQVRNVTYSGTMLIVERTDGPPVVLARELAPSETLGIPDYRAELVAMRIRQMLAHHAEIAAKDPTAVEKERRAMPIAKWIAELRATPEKVATYRVAADDRNFEEIFADGSIDVVTRACAAFALKAREGDSATPRLRVAASTSASPKLRVALEKIADGAPDSEIARSIEKLR